MTYELDKEVLLATDSARLKVLTDFVMGLTKVPEDDVINGATLREQALAAMQESIEAGRQAFYQGSMG